VRENRIYLLVLSGDKFQHFVTEGPCVKKNPSDVARGGLFWTPEEKRQRGRPKTTWRRYMHLIWGEIQKVAQDTSCW